MKEELFREKSLDKVKSPDKADEYLRVANPSFWIVIAAIIILAAAFFVWGYLGEIPTKLNAMAAVQDGELTLLLPEAERGQVDDSMDVLIEGKSFGIKSISSEPVSADDIKAVQEEYDYFKLNPAAWNYLVKADVAGISDGVKPAAVVLEKVRPITLMLNRNNEEANE